MAPWVGRSLESILSQKGDFTIELIMTDAASSDGSYQIFEEYRKKVESGEFPTSCAGITFKGVSEKDNGTFDAINKGFAMATGDILTWCDTDNTFEPGAFAAVALAFETFPEIEWIKANGNTMNERWEKTRLGNCRLFRQDWIQQGIYGREAYAMEQNGCFWSMNLWKKAGPIPTTFKVAGDYWFWMHMALHGSPISLDYRVSNFMVREGQLHNSGGYRKEQVQARPRRTWAAWCARLLFSPQSRFAPHLDGLAQRIYTLFFMGNPKPMYIAIENGVAVKRAARSYMCV